MESVDKAFIIQNALKYLRKLKRNEQIKSRSEMENLNYTMEQLESQMYQSKSKQVTRKKDNQEIIDYLEETLKNSNTKINEKSIAYAFGYFEAEIEILIDKLKRGAKDE